MKMKKKLFYFLLACNFIYAQFPSASFEANQYSISEDTNNFSATLEIENPDSLDIWAFLIWLYADTSVIRLKDASWHTNSPFQYSNFTSNVSNDTLKIATYTSQTGSLYSGTGGKILDIEFDIVGSSGDSTLLEFVRFEFSDSYINNAISSNILITGIQTIPGCTDPSACNYNINANEDDGTCQMFDECGECGGPATNMDDGEYDNGACGCKGTNGAEENEYPIDDECGICGGDNSFCSDCAGVPYGAAYITPCGDCSVGSTCVLSNISVDVETMDNNFRSDNIVVPIYLNNYEFISSPDNLSTGLEGLEFIISYNPDTLLFNAEQSFPVIDNFISFFQEQNTGQITGTILFNPQEGCEENDNCGEIYNYDGAFANLSFDVIDSIYNSALHESITQISLNLTEINGIQVNIGTGSPLEGSGNLTIYTSACIDPFASTSEDLNFVCFECDNYNNECDENYYGDLCDEDGIIPDSDIFNDKDLCELPDPLVFENSTDILFDSIIDNVVSGDIVKNINYGTCSNNGSQCSMDSDCYSSDEVPDDTTLASETDGECNLNYNFTLEIPESTVVIFPENEENILHLRSSDVEKKYLSDIAPGAQLAGSLVGLYPFGVTFEEQEDNPIKFTFTFNDLSRGVSEYKLLYMNDIDDLQNHDWTEIGTCTSDSLIQENFRFCSINGLPGSGLFIVMYGENLSIDDNIELPSDFILYRNFPNPFNPVTTLEFDVPVADELTFIIYNVNGQIIDTIPSKYYFAGSYQVQWDASEFSSGIYLIQMKSNNVSYFQKVMLLK